MRDFKKILNRRLGHNVSLLLLIVFVGSVLRFVNLGGKAFNFDESVTVWESYFLSHDLIRYVNLCEGTPFLFPLIISIVNKINESEFFLRLLPCIFGILSIIMIYFFSKEFMSARTALISSLLVSLSSLQVTKSQEVRYYSLVMLLTLLVCWFYFKYLISKDTKFLLLFTLFSMMYIFTSYIYFIILIAFNILFLCLTAQKKQKLSDVIQWIFVQIILLFGVFIIWNINLKYQFHWLSNPPEFFKDGIPRNNNIIEYFRFSIVNTLRLFDFFYANNKIVSFLLIFLFFVGLVALLRIKEKNRIVYFFIITVFVNIILAIFKKFVYIPLRHCMYLSPFYYLIIAKGFDAIFLSGAKTRFNKVLFCIVLGMVIYTGLWNVRNYLISPGPGEIRELINYLNNEAKPDERIYVYTATNYAFQYYYRSDISICRFGTIWESSQKDAELIAREIDYYFKDVKKGWVLTMMQNYLDSTTNILLTNWNIDEVILNKLGDVKLLHISRKN